MNEPLKDILAKISERLTASGFIDPIDDHSPQSAEKLLSVYISSETGATQTSLTAGFAAAMDIQPDQFISADPQKFAGEATRAIEEIIGALKRNNAKQFEIAFANRGDDKLNRFREKILVAARFTK